MVTFPEGIPNNRSLPPIGKCIYNSSDLFRNFLFIQNDITGYNNSKYDIDKSFDKGSRKII